MSDNIILRFIIRLILPFIFMYGLYVQFHGEYSPGGGFQAGVICASAFICYCLVHGLSETMRVLPVWAVRLIASFGALLYGAVGILGMLKGGHFLDYSVLLEDSVKGQGLGILVIELGVGLTVFGVMMIIFYMFADRSR